ncbi:MAG TPA: type I-E CRISPR-associated endonuclease Cas1e [Longimicrobiaceae bacterium]|nr:type I-E CRISPR-associated endonuclease Cas1e [Longimicrobiaceae bacterium]
MLQIKDRLSFFYVQRGGLTVIDGCLVLTDNEDCTQYEVPARATTVIMVGPGTTVSTEAIRLAAAYGVLITWVGEHGVRCYSAGRPWGDNIEWLDKQVKCYSDPSLTLKVAREMFYHRFGVRMERRSIEQLRGIEGARVRELYKLKAAEYKIPWSGRNYVPGNPFGTTDAPNLALNVANTCMYGLVETAIHAAGMSPALGFVHRGDRLSFVLDIADLYKMEHMVPLAFGLVAKKGQGAKPWPQLEMDVRRACRDYFKTSKLLDRIVNDSTALIDAGLGA